VAKCYMATEIKHIECPEDWQSGSDWDSHRPLLWLAATKAKNRVIEFGCGEGSTELLRGLISEPKGRFVTFETDLEWAIKCCSRYTLDYLCDSVVDYFFSGQTPVSLTFIDCAPGEIRKTLIEKYDYKSEMILVHDSEPGAEYVYGMSEVLKSFKHRLDYRPEGKPHSTLVSNFIDVSKFVE